MSNKFEFGSQAIDDAADVSREAIQQAIQDLAREGLIVDSGRRRWSERTGRYEIVWIARKYMN